MIRKFDGSLKSNHDPNGEGLMKPLFFATAKDGLIDGIYI
jgi:hypothetical protein